VRHCFANSYSRPPHCDIRSAGPASLTTSVGGELASAAFGNDAAWICSRFEHLQVEFLLHPIWNTEGESNGIRHQIRIIRFLRHTEVMLVSFDRSRILFMLHHEGIIAIRVLGAKDLWLADGLKVPV
jgi:hypothetical protein